MFENRTLLPNLLMPAPGIKLARHFLEAIGAPPWGVIALGQQHSLTAKTPSLQKLMERAQKQRQGIIAVLPVEAGKVRHVIIHVPPGARRDDLPMPPSIVIMARETTLIWSLSDFTKADVAKTLATRLAKLTGGRAEHGACVPLPGSILYAVNGATMTQMWQVRMLPPNTARYGLINGHLVAPASPAASPAYDSRVLSVPLGTAADKSPVIWTPGRLTNGFALVLGSSGSGKTETLKALGAGIRHYGVPVLVFDFHGDVKIPGVRDVLLSSGTESMLGINPLELDGTCGKQSGLYDQRGALREMILRACPTLGHRQSNALREAIEQVYAKAGIVDADPTTWTRPPPTFADLIKEMKDEGLKAGASELFGHPIFQRTEHIGIGDLLHRSTRLDLSQLSDGVRFIATETLLQRIFRALRMRGAIAISPSNDLARFRLFVIIDEAKILAMGGGANILDTLLTEARKFGLGMILASQRAEHFSSDVQSNAATWLVLKPQAMGEARRNATEIGVTPEQLMGLKERGDGYFRAGNGKEAKWVHVQKL